MVVKRSKPYHAIHPIAPPKRCDGTMLDKVITNVGYIGPMKNPTKEIAIAFSTRLGTNQMVSSSPMHKKPYR